MKFQFEEIMSGVPHAVWNENLTKLLAEGSEGK